MWLKAISDFRSLYTSIVFWANASMIMGQAAINKKCSRFWCQKLALQYVVCLLGCIHVWAHACPLAYVHTYMHAASKVYMACTVGHHMQCFMWQLAAQCTLQFKFVMCWGPHLLDQCTAVNIRFLLNILGAWGSVVVKTLRYKSVGPGIDSKRWRLEFILWQLTFPCALGSTQPLKMSTRIFLGVKAAGA